MKEYNKLVRDLIPQVIKNDGKYCTYYNAEKKDIQDLLIAKLDEEVAEFKESGKIEELADIIEVCYGIASFLNYSERDLENAKKDKFIKYGGFYTGVVLQKVDDVPIEEDTIKPENPEA